MSCPPAAGDVAAAGFRAFFNSATSEWIEYTAVGADAGEDLVRFNWRSLPGGAITEHLHPHQEERFIITAGAASFTLDGDARVVAAGETLVVPAGVRTRAQRRTGRGRGHRRAAPGLHTKEMHEAFAGLAARAAQLPGRTAQPAPARGHLLAFPPRNPRHGAGAVAAEPGPAATLGAREDLWRGVRIRLAGTAGSRRLAQLTRCKTRGGCSAR